MFKNKQQIFTPVNTFNGHKFKVSQYLITVMNVDFKELKSRSHFKNFSLVLMLIAFLMLFPFRQQSFLLLLLQRYRFILGTVVNLICISFLLGISCNLNLAQLEGQNYTTLLVRLCASVASLVLGLCTSTRKSYLSGHIRHSKHSFIRSY